MSNEELAIAIQQGDQGRTLELWEQVNGLVKRKAMQIMTALKLSGNPRGVEFDDLYQTGYLAMVAAYAFLSIHLDGLSVLDFLSFVVSFYITEQQIFEWEDPT